MSTTGEFSEKVALITGAGSGIGAATARLFADEGARVGLLCNKATELSQVAGEIRARNGMALELMADVSDQQEVAGAVRRLTDEWGRLDFVFANAGVNGVWAPLDEITVEEWNHAVDVNLKGTFLTVRESLPWLKRLGGVIIITASVNGTRMFSNSGATAYACSKAGQVAFAKMAAVELAKHRIRVNVVCPGFVETPIHDKTVRRGIEELHVPVEYPKGPIPLTGNLPAHAEQVADLVLFLASDRASHITGTEIFIDGAQSLLQG